MKYPRTFIGSRALGLRDVPELKRQEADEGPSAMHPLTASAILPRKQLITGVFLMVLGMITPVAMSDDVPDVSGTRTGLWSMSNSGGTVRLTVNQNGPMVSGDIALQVDLKGARDYSYGAISGTVSRRNGQYVLSFSSGRLRADLDISDTEIKGPFCLQLCGTMSFAR